MSCKDSSGKYFILVYIRQISRRYEITFRGKVIAVGTPGMFLCRDTRGFLWFETVETLRKYYTPVTCACGFFVSTRVEMQEPRRRFLLKIDNGPVFDGTPDDQIAFYPSGACYVLRPIGNGKNALLPLVLFGSTEKQKVKMIM